MRLRENSLSAWVWADFQPSWTRLLGTNLLLVHIVSIQIAKIIWAENQSQKCWILLKVLKQPLFSVQDKMCISDSFSNPSFAWCVNLPQQPWVGMGVFSGSTEVYFFESVFPKCRRIKAPQHNPEALPLQWSESDSGWNPPSDHLLSIYIQIIQIIKKS